MNTKKITAILIAVALLSLSAAAQNKNQLKQENTHLKSVVDSLNRELAKTRAELQYTDSLASELLALYADSEVKNQGKLMPEDYTA